jgi:hypothetical protein
MRYPTNAPTATASMIQPLYVMNSNLQLLAPNPRCLDLRSTYMMKNE